jgi:hypothetical protein
VRHWPAMTGRECLINLGVIGAPVEPRNVTDGGRSCGGGLASAETATPRPEVAAHLARSEGLEPSIF